MFRLQRLEITGFKSFADHTELNFTGEGITAIVGPNGCGKCVSGDTLVTLSDGREVPIADLVNAALEKSHSIEQLDDGELTRENPQQAEILSLNPKSLRLEPRRVSAFVKRTATPELMRIRTRSGREIKATPYHPLFTLDECGSLKALRADEVKTGLRIAVPRRLPTQTNTVDLQFTDFLKLFAEDDRVFVPYSNALREWTTVGQAKLDTFARWSKAAGVSVSRVKGLREGQALNAAAFVRLAETNRSFPTIPSQIKSKSNGLLNLPTRLTVDLARFLGLLVAEGRNTKSNQVWFVNSDEAVNDELARLADKIFGLKVCRRNYKQGAVDSLIFSRSLCLTLDKLFNFSINSNSFEKEVPPQIFTSDTATKWAFLSGLFEGDAYICARQQKSNGKRLSYIEYTTASEQLARGVVSLLLQCGVFSLVRPRQKYAANTARQTRKTYFSVLIYGAENLQTAAQGLSFVGAKRERLAVLGELSQTPNPNYDLIPNATLLVKDAARLAGVKIKPNRKRFPKLAAYCEQACEASRTGTLEVVKQIRDLSSSQASAAEAVLDRLSALATSDVYWDAVVSVESTRPADEWVYDLSVAETHNFVAGNIIVHNSNVSDAISWVLGEQRAKTLRGGEMKDVIFQGTRSRSASGMAEVVLHLVRDDSVAADEAEIEDIDTQLEGIDERRDETEEKLHTTLDATLAAQQTTDGQTADVQQEDKATDLTIRDATAAHAGGELQNTSPRGASRRTWRPSRIALEFAPGEAVSITRRLYGSGESEYLLNNRQCRLRDIQDLFSGTGLSGGHYAIIEQGRIGQILSAKPMDRRALIEEAAGITKFRVRQRHAESRLDSARLNLSRISDIVSEIERQAGSLRRQAAKARRYQQLRDEMRGSLMRLYVADYHSLTGLTADLRGRLEDANAYVANLAKELNAHESQAREATNEARQREQELAEAREAASTFALQADRNARELGYQQQQQQTLAQRISETTVETERVRERQQTVEREVARLRAQDDELKLDTETTARELSEVESAYNERTAQVAAREAERERLRDELLKHTAIAERLSEIERQLVSALERLAQQAEGLQREAERAETAHAAAHEEAAQLETEIAKADVHVAGLHAEREQATSVLTGARDSLRLIEAEHTEAREQFARARNRFETLNELNTRRAYYSEAVQKIFAAEDEATGEGSTRETVKGDAVQREAMQIAPKDFYFAGTLADVVQVAPDWERAVESVFGGYLQSVIVPTMGDAMRAAAWLRQHNYGRATFLVTGLHGGSNDADALEHTQTISDQRTIFDRAETVAQAEIISHARLGDLLNAPEEIAALLQRTLTREMNTRLSSNLEDAVWQSLETGETFVTPAGEWLASGTLLNAGATVSETGEGASLLAFKREMRELEQRTIELEAATAYALQRTEEQRARVSELEDAVVLLNDVIGREEREQVARGMRRSQLAQEIERTARHKKVVADDTARLEQERTELAERRAVAETDAAAAAEARDAAATEVSRAAELLLAARQAAEAESERLSLRRAAAATAAERRRAVVAELKRMEHERAELDERHARYAQEIANAEARINELLDSISEIEETSQQHAGEQTTFEQSIAERTATLADARELADNLAAELVERHRQITEAREGRSQLEVQQAETQARLSYLRESCQNELGQTLEDLSSKNSSDDAADTLAQNDADGAQNFVAQQSATEALRARVEELRARLESFGAVNMMALEELSEAEARFEFLTTQRQDVLDGIHSTEEALREIKRRSRERFRQAFEEVNRNFSRLFNELFGGGRGEMTLIDADDVLESGIDIIAQPPGKRLQNVLLLSGGEKAMAALALLLAVFRYRPSPFCLLDEVDAPLDEANVGRFTAKIVEMAEQTQFIVITHNKRTMESARALYGVTMEEAGISKLLSVKFE